MSKQTSLHTRREVLRLTAAGMGGATGWGWLPLLAGEAAQTAAQGRPHKACIVLWMSGGPSHKDTFDLKPGTSDGGDFQPISTSVPGVAVSEHFPRLARLMHHAALVRSMSTGEADHGRAGILMHTGFRPASGGLKRPNLGAIVSAELGDRDALLPNFVVCGQGNRVDPSAAGFLGPRHEGLTVRDPAGGLDDLRPAATAIPFSDRADLLARLEAAGRGVGSLPLAAAQRATYARALNLMRSEKAQAFDLAREPGDWSARYGASEFGQGCLLARRLVEYGVPFVEVVLPGWDTHQRNSAEVKRLSQIVDPALSALLTDLLDRGLLDNTLVVWMGEFGRTPRFNPQGGRDHYAQAWSTLLLGGGVPGGQVIGRTDREGAHIEDRPVSVAAFMATLCTILGIRTDKVYDGPGGRTVRLLDEGAEPIAELLPS